MRFSQKAQRKYKLVTANIGSVITLKTTFRVPIMDGAGNTKNFLFIKGTKLECISIPRDGMPKIQETCFGYKVINTCDRTLARGTELYFPPEEHYKLLGSTDVY